MCEETIIAEILDGRLPVAAPSVHEVLRQFTRRVRELGGKYVHRYPHARDTKFYFCAEVPAFEQAAKELGLHIEVRSMSKWGTTHHKNVYVMGLTLKGSRRCQHSASN